MWFVAAKLQPATSSAGSWDNKFSVAQSGYGTMGREKGEV